MREARRFSFSLRVKKHQISLLIIKGFVSQRFISLKDCLLAGPSKSYINGLVNIKRAFVKPTEMDAQT